MNSELVPTGCGKWPPAAFSRRAETYRTARVRFASSLAAALLDANFAHPVGDSDTDTAHDLIVAYRATIAFFAVCEAVHATLAGSLPFPDIMRHLLGAGVEYYHVDYIPLQFTFYGANAASVVAPLTFEGLPAVAKDFDAVALRQAILDSQQKGQPYREFS